MADRLAIVERFLERHDAEDSTTHITYSESLAFYNGSTDRQLPDRIMLEGQKTIFSCVVCSVIFAESLPGTSPVGHRAVNPS